MAQSVLETKSASAYSILVTITFTSTIVRLWRGTTTLTSNGQTFQPAPSLLYRMNKPQTGSSQDGDCEILCSRLIFPFDVLSAPFPAPKMNAVIEEIKPGDDTTRRILFSGQISRVTSHSTAAELLVKCKVAGPKANLNRTLSLQALTNCPWTFGNENGSPCNIDVASKEIAVTVTTLNYGSVSNRVLLTFSSSPPDLALLRWNRGFVQVNGVKLGIRNVFSDSSFDLVDIPPPSWLGQLGKIRPGCAKQIANCRFWSNEAKFGGFGFALPPYSPIYQQG